MLQSTRKETRSGKQAERPTTKAFVTEVRRPVTQVPVGDVGRKSSGEVGRKPSGVVGHRTSVVGQKTSIVGHKPSAGSREPTLIGLAPPPAEYAPVPSNLQAPTREQGRVPQKDERRLAAILVAGTLIAMFAIAFSALPEGITGRPASDGAVKVDERHVEDPARVDAQLQNPAAAPAAAKPTAARSSSKPNAALPKPAQKSAAGTAPPKRVAALEVPQKTTALTPEPGADLTTVVALPGAKVTGTVPAAKVSDESKSAEPEEPRLADEKRARSSVPRSKVAGRAAARRRARPSRD